ncbi:MAG: penicillin-binding protein 2 [Parcubacteria group bacterium]|nr:penicillin-binding protein 2 [Parcubacteria group bacterium]
MITAPATRINLLYVVVFLLALVLLGKLFLVQIIYGGEYSERAHAQYVSPVADSFKRGSIYFTKKDGTLLSAATLARGYTLAINPRELGDSEDAFQKLSSIVPDLNLDAFLLKAAKRDDPYEEIKTRLPEELAERVRALKLPGVGVYEEKWRFYPSEELGAHVLGFVGYEGERLRGRYGVERYYEDTLARVEEEVRINFFADAFAGLRETLLYERAPREGDLVLTLEPEVERFLEHSLNGIMDEWKADSGGAIVVNPKNGEIYAMAARPTFDPNDFSDVSSYTVFSNSLVEDVYELGSIMKPLTMAAGIDAGVVSPKETYYDKGYVVLNQARIQNHDGKGRGEVSMQEVLNQSLNTGAVYVMQQLGRERFSAYMKSFGLGEETGIDLPNETHGLIDNLLSPRDIEHATASFGQGIAVSPVAMVRALSALANGGVLITPHVASRINHKFGTYEISYGGEKRVLKEETSEEITRMLVRVVDEALAGGGVSLPHWSVAAKTGTAQIAKAESGGYYDNKFLHSFFGYFPAFDPKFFVFYYIVNPKGVRYASETLTNPFMETAKFLINYYEVPPDR